MGMTLFDQKTNAIIFDTNFWHWRAIVEAVRALKVLPDSRVDPLHDAYIGELTESETRTIAKAIRERLLPTIMDGERLLLDGERTTEQDDGTMHYDPVEQHKNYSTNSIVLEEFANCCAACGGFRVS